MDTLLQIVMPPDKQMGVQFVWYWIVVYTFIVATYSTIRQIFTCRWAKTEGKLIDYGVEKFGTSIADPSMQEYKIDALYRYEVDATEYEGSEVSAWKMIASHNLKSLLKYQLNGVKIGENGEIDVYYNPKNPSKALLVLPCLKSQLITMSIGITPVVIYIFSYYS